MVRYRATFALCLWSCAWTAQSADDLESLDEDFLAYLAEFEGDADDWTIVEPPRTAAIPAAKPAAASAPASVSSQPSKKPPPGSKPATPDDGSKR